MLFSRLVSAAMVAGAIAIGAGGAAPAAQAANCPWMNTSLSPQARAHMLVAAMSLDQKVSMVHGGGTSVGTSAGAISAIPSLCVPALGLTDGAGGVGNGNTGVTAFPAPMAQSASFDTAQQLAFGRALGAEYIGKGDNQWLAPNVNIARYPLNGRTFEDYGEDPFLSGEIAVADVKGMQSQHVIATPKHYILNESETNRNYEDSRVDDRTLHEIYMTPFEAAVERGGAGSVMCAYNRVNTFYSCDNDYNLNTVLKGQFGFSGFVVSDWVFATHSPTYALHGLDMEMPFGLGFASMSELAQAGVFPMSRLDDMVYRIVYSMFRLGLFDHPVSDPPLKDVSTPDHRALARRMAANGSVLLKNDGTLPVTGKHLTIAVIGPVDKGGAGNVCSGGGSAVVNCDSQVSALDAIKARAARDGDTVLFDDGSDTTSAAATAAKADVAFAFGYYTESEGSNRSSLDLDGSGDALISAVAAANKHTVAVLETGGPTLMPWLGSVAGVLEAFYPGVEGNRAIADILFGDVNPGGHLPLTFPKSTADLPTAGSPTQEQDDSPVELYSEGLDVGYRWYDAKNIAPLFPFGYGLSYTTFSFSGLNVADTGDGENVTFTVTNTGTRAGSDVAQVYVGAPASAGEPPQQLKGFQKVRLASGQSTTVTIPLGERAFSHWDTDQQSWVVDPGCYEIKAGDASRGQPLVTTGSVFGGSCSSGGGAASTTTLGGIQGLVAAQGGKALR